MLNSLEKIAHGSLKYDLIRARKIIMLLGYGGPSAFLLLTTSKDFVKHVYGEAYLTDQGIAIP